MSEADRLNGETGLARSAVYFRYTNYRGETSMRRAVPISLLWRATKHHPEAQWILEAHDMDKKAIRDFALRDCDFTPHPAGWGEGGKGHAALGEPQ